MINEEKYSKCKVEGQKMIIQVLKHWKRGQERKKGGESKRIAKQTRETNDDVYAHDINKRIEKSS